MRVQGRPSRNRDTYPLQAVLPLVPSSAGRTGSENAGIHRQSREFLQDLLRDGVGSVLRTPGIQSGQDYPVELLVFRHSGMLPEA
jgi:hypothetical protein